MPSTHIQRRASPTGQCAADQGARKCATLEAKIATLEAQIGDTRTKLDAAAAQLKYSYLDPLHISPSHHLKNPNAPQTVQSHIRLLRGYNDIRDIGTGLLGIIADSRLVQIKQIYEEFDVNEKD
ncbi:MAG: hypothetical protein Q9184_000204 [Pyrenodesmia sp. 2 TL-2023]